MTDNGMIEVFRGDEQGGFSPRYFLSFVFLCFCLLGVMRGINPPHSHDRLCVILYIAI